MARPSRTMRDRHLTKCRRRLLDAAAIEFARAGYVGANINHISLKAGFAKGTIYNYFASKRALMMALIDLAAAAHTEAVLKAVASESNPTVRLEHFFSAGFDFVERHPAQAKVLVAVVYGPESEFKKRVYKAYDRLFSLIIQDILKEGVAQDSFRAIDPDLTTALIMAVYFGSCSQVDSRGKIWIAPSDAANFILDGLCRQNPLGKKA